MTQFYPYIAGSTGTNAIERPRIARIYPVYTGYLSIYPIIPGIWASLDTLYRAIIALFLIIAL